MPVAKILRKCEQSKLRKIVRNSTVNHDEQDEKQISEIDGMRRCMDLLAKKVKQNRIWKKNFVFYVYLLD